MGTKRNLQQVVGQLQPGLELSNQETAEFRARVKKQTGIDPAKEPQRALIALKNKVDPGPQRDPQVVESWPSLSGVIAHLARTRQTGSMSLALATVDPGLGASQGGGDDMGKTSKKIWEEKNLSKGCLNFISANMTIVAMGFLLLISIAVGPLAWAVVCVFLAWATRKGYGKIPALLAGGGPALLLAMNSPWLGWLAVVIVAIVAFREPKSNSKKKDKDDTDNDTGDDDDVIHL